jgi:predicted O-methyltransferase YrrM
MFTRWQLLQRYLSYYFTASNGKGHGMHSPFVFHFITKVLNDKTVYPEYEKVEALRKQLLKDDSVIEVTDMGAGSGQSGKTSQRVVSSIARHAAKPKKFGQLLFRMVKYYQPKQVIELGTSLGITSSYLALGNPAATVNTMEGAPAIARKAEENFRSAGLSNISITEGNFDRTLFPLLNTLPGIDLAFIDGNHRQEPTERYFRQILPHINNDSILIFDDIHCSHEMEAAWDAIKADPAVRCSIDLFFIGIVFFRKEFMEKQHFMIRF